MQFGGAQTWAATALFPSLIYIFKSSVEYICCEIISADDIASGEVVRYKRVV